MNEVASAIFGAKTHSGQGDATHVINPATEETIGTFHDAEAGLVDQTVRAAKAAFESGVWSRASVAERQAGLRKIADIIEDHGDELADLEIKQTGLVTSQVRGMHTRRAAYNFRFFADFIGQADEKLHDQDENYLTYVRRSPVGVAALIAPWNAPIALGSMKIAASICFGNSCVLKPSEIAPLSLVRLVELINASGLPENVVNLVNGRGHTTGDTLVRHPDVNVVSFTGGTATGKKIMAAAGEGLKPSTMELGGKSANVIFADADLDRALDAAIMAIYAGNGQQCLVGSRIMLEASIADDFIKEFVRRAEKLKIGDPFDPTSNIGPLISAAHRERVESFVGTGTGEGAQLLTGGARPEGFDRGYYFKPTAMMAPSNDIALCQQEIFGPFAAFLTFESDEDAYAMANGTEFGLVSYLWTQSVDRLMQAQERLHSGVVWVNTPMMRELRAPFGGYGASGVGAEGGESCQSLYTRQKTVTIPRKPVNLPKWGA
ncbi:MAG: aldehyde dehydrogenase [Pseudomonadota bacterium]